MDCFCGQWASVVRSQGHRLEIIEVCANLHTIARILACMGFLLPQQQCPTSAQHLGLPAA